MERLAEFTTVYQKKTKHRKKCIICGKLIADGAEVVAVKSMKEKFYPVKGIMNFVVWHFSHVSCK